MAGSGEGSKGEAAYAAWKARIPYIYDWFANHHLTWPSLSCRWGPVVEDLSIKRIQKLYLSEQTDGSEPNKLMIMQADVYKPRIAAAEPIVGWEPDKGYKHMDVSKKVIYHDGEVNKIRDVPGHADVLVTHTDSKDLYVWNVERQPDRGGDKDTTCSVADLVLTGHTDIAAFALGVSNAAPCIASGGTDTKVVVWNLQDEMGGLTAAPGKQRQGKAGELKPRSILSGHKANVEDVSWMPGSATELASVGDDKNLMFWDTREGDSPTIKVEQAHGNEPDLHCVDWSALNTDQIATGAADGTLMVWDKRMLSNSGTAHKEQFKFGLHSGERAGSIMSVEWNPNVRGVLASGGEDKAVCVWKLDAGGEPDRRKSRVPKELIFQHGGHRAPVVDFQWYADAADPYMMMSASDDVELDQGGGTLQMWRIVDMIYRPTEEVLREIEEHREFIIDGKLPEKLSKPIKPKAEPAKAAASAQGDGGDAKSDEAPQAKKAKTASNAEDGKSDTTKGEVAPMDED